MLFIQVKPQFAVYRESKKADKDYLDPGEIYFGCLLGGHLDHDYVLVKVPFILTIYSWLYKVCFLFSHEQILSTTLFISTLFEIIHQYGGKDTTDKRSKIHHCLRIQKLCI